MGSLSLLFLCVSPALAIATNPSQENPYTEQNDDSVTQQRTRKVTGVVLDANGESIIGANVVVKGTNNGTITDLDGKFSIELSDVKPCKYLLSAITARTLWLAQERIISRYSYGKTRRSSMKW